MGRPKYVEHPHSQQVAVWLTGPEKAVLDEMTAEMGSYRSAVIRQAIAEMALRRNGAAADAAFTSQEQ